MGMINNTVWPEMSMAFGRGDLPLMRNLHRYSCQASLWLCGLITVLLVLFGQAIMRVWTQGKVIPEADFFYLMLFVISANSLWYTSSVVHVAINKHRKLALAYIFGSGISLILAAFAFIPFFGLKGAPISLLVIDVSMFLYVIQRSLKLVDDKIRTFLGALIKPPPVHDLLKIIIPKRI